jgi:uncharacterized protein (DUF433 family)
MSEEIAKDRTENRTVSKTRQFYGFMNAIKYDEDLVAELRHDYEESGLITDPLEGRIAIDPEIDHGKPVIKGTRVPVDIILGSLAGGMETQEVANEYGLEREDVLVANGICGQGRFFKKVFNLSRFILI